MIMVIIEGVFILCVNFGAFDQNRCVDPRRNCIKGVDIFCSELGDLVKMIKEGGWTS